MYYRLCETLADKGKLIPTNKPIGDLIKNQSKDYYVSVFEYSEEQKKKFDETGSVAGINDVKTNRMIFDFDSKTDIELARRDTKKLVRKLLRLGLTEDDLLITFSGNKGFGVEFNLEESLTPNEAKQYAKALCQGMKTFDTVVYNASRILRVPFTKHPESGLYKLPLSYEELKDLTLEEIKDFAKDEYEPEFRELNAVNLNELDIDLEIVPEKPKNEVLSAPTGDLGLDLTKKPKWLSNWKYALSEGLFPPGTRNYSLMILAATYRGQGLPPEVVHRMLKGTVELQTRRFGQDKYDSDKIWKEIIKTVYSDSWQGGTYAEMNFPDELVDFFKEIGLEQESKKEEMPELIENVSDGFNDFVNYANQIDEFTMKFGIPSLDRKLKIRKGHLVYLLAPPGAGKTSFAITLLNNMSKQGTGCYFGSYDMYKNNVYQKLIQRHTGLPEEKLYDVFREKNTKEIEKFRKILENNYANVSFCFKVGQTIGDLKRSIAWQEEITGRKIELVIVDYLELVLTESNDPTAASAEAAQGLREIANEGRVVVGLLQPNKMNSKPNEPILSYNGAKGSSTIAQSGTAILTGHRPGMSSTNNNEDDNFFGINCVKNRNGPLFSLDFAWEGKTQTIRELEDIEREELRDLRKRLAEQAEDED